MSSVSAASTVCPALPLQPLTGEAHSAYAVATQAKSADKLDIKPHQCSGPACCPTGVNLEPKQKARRDYTVEDIRQKPLNKLGRFLIRYGYQWPTRKMPGLSNKAQHSVSRCGCRLCGPAELSCSEYGYRAFEVLSAPWALASTVLRLASCNPLTFEGPLARLLANPMPFKDFKQQAKEAFSQHPLIEGSDLSDLLYFGSNLFRELVLMPFTLTKKLALNLAGNPGSKKKKPLQSEYFEKKGDPGPSDALFSLNVRRWYFLGKAAEQIKAKNFEQTRLNPWKIDPD